MSAEEVLVQILYRQLFLCFVLCRFDGLITDEIAASLHVQERPLSL